jgi:ABC-2 type transport system ATP-binding protein
VRVRSPQAARLRELIGGPDVSVSSEEAGVLTVKGLEPDRIGSVAAEHGITLFELAPQHASLEDAFMELTQDSVEYAAIADDRQLAVAGRISI